MCCFSRPVKSVSATRIFARMGEGARQFVVYSMNLDSAEPLAMVLPIPVAAGSDEAAVRFINLKNYANFFDDLSSGFPVPPPASEGRSRSISAASSERAPLQVFQVGSFEASFVPTVGDFGRLDERFRLPESAFVRLPGYKTFGFTVFKLKAGEQTVHPMAFEFPTASRSRLFFPTVHIHDGQVHDRAGFDHALYCQSAPNLRWRVLSWKESPRPAGKFMDVKKAEGIVLSNEHCHRLELHGMLDNKDTFVEAA
jgi:hypothetical protein